MNETSIEYINLIVANYSSSFREYCLHQQRWAVKAVFACFSLPIFVVML